MQKIIIGFIIALIIVAGGAFYGGMLYGKSRNSNSGMRNLSGQFGQMGGPNGQFNRQGKASTASGNLVNGYIIAKDDKGITVKLQDGGSKIIFLSASTQVSKMASGSNADLEIGKTVMVTGTTNTDGSVTAQTIQLRPAALITASSTPQK